MIDQIDLYCDGSRCKIKHTYPGWAYAIYFGEELLKSQSGIYATSRYQNSFTGELAGFVFGIQDAIKYKPALVVVYIDEQSIYEYLVKNKRKPYKHHPLWNVLGNILERQEIIYNWIVFGKHQNEKHSFVHQLAKKEASIRRFTNTGWMID